MSANLTPRQADALTFIRNFNDRRGHAPSYEEIAAGLGVGSKSVVYRLISALEERGHIRRIPHRARCIELIEQNPLRSATTGALIAELHRRGVGVPCPHRLDRSEAGDGAAATSSHGVPPRQLNSVVHGKTYAGARQSNHG